MHTTSITRTVVAAGLVLGLASCAGPGSGSPEPTVGGETTSSAAADDPFHIENPKDLTAISDPCKLLTPQQVQQLGAGPPKPDETAWKQAACLWRNQQLAVKIGPDTKQRQKFSYTAKIYGDGSGKPSEVKGHPSVNGPSNDLRCSTYVATAKKEQLYVSFTVGSDGRGNPEYADPCAMSDKIAGMVLENLPPT